MPTVDKYQKDNDRRKQAYNYFISKGYSPQASAGIVGNLVHESGLNTTIEGDKNLSSSSFGAAQWRGERLKRLKERYGKKWTDFNNQLDFIDWELNNTHKNAGTKLQGVQTVHEAGQIFSDYYEIPKKKYYENEARRLAVERVGRDFIQEGNTTGNINSKPINFENTTDFSSFDSYQQLNHTKKGQNLPTVQDIEEEAPKEQESTSKEKEALLQRQREYQFLQDLSKGIIQTQTEQQPQQERIEIPQIDPLQEYQEISAFVENPIMQEGGQIPISRNGVHDYPNQKVIVPTNSISMKGVNYPILGIGDNGEQKIMMPNLEYFFSGSNNVLEIPLKFKK